MPHFEFAERKGILAQQRKDEEDDRVRIIAAQKKATSDLKNAFCAYLESIGSHPHVYVSSDAAFTVSVGRIGFEISTNRDETFDFRAAVESGAGQKRISGHGLSAEAVTDALLKVCHPELNS